MKKVPFQKKLLVCAVISGLASSFSYGQQDEESDIEEVVVTGSFIRSSPIDAPSPVQVVDRANNVRAGQLRRRHDAGVLLRPRLKRRCLSGGGPGHGLRGVAPALLGSRPAQSQLRMLNGLGFLVWAKMDTDSALSASSHVGQ